MTEGPSRDRTDERDPATDYSYDFVTEALPEGAVRVLEIGCGEGLLAERLQADGFEVLALDSNPDCVAAARARGVEARRSRWPDSSFGRFDAVLFTRSLHHVDDLDGGVAAAFDCLEKAGRLIVEDFDFDYRDEATLGWFADLLRDPAAGLDPGASRFLAALATAGQSPLEAWRSEHHHELHSAAAIEAALRRRAARVDVDGAAYFFRYLAGAAAPARVRAVRGQEIALIRAGSIEPLGRRFVAQL